MILSIIVSLTVTFYIYKKLYDKPDGIPPGDWGSLISGNQIRSKHELQNVLQVQKEKYGNIFSLKFGSQIVIFLADIENIKKAKTKLEFKENSEAKSSEMETIFSPFGIQHLNDHLWQRRSHLKAKSTEEFSLQKYFIEGSNEDQIKQFLTDFEELVKEKPVLISLKKTLDAFACDVLLNLTAGIRVKKSEAACHKLPKTILSTLRILDKNAETLLAFSWALRHAPEFIQYDFLHLHKLNKNWKYFKKHLLGYIKKNEKKFEADDPTNFSDLRLIDSNGRNVQKESLDYGKYITNFVTSTYNLLLGEFETASIAILLFLSHMRLFPDIQSKIQRELDEVCETEPISLQNKNNLPYFVAALLEFNRFFSAIPNEPIGVMAEDSMLNGYNFPKGALVYGCDSLCHFDQKYFPDPEHFRPERFLDCDGKLNNKFEGYVPFILDKRFPALLSEMTLFLVCGSILQKFNIHSLPRKNGEVIEDVAFVLKRRTISCKN